MTLNVSEPGQPQRLGQQTVKVETQHVIFLRVALVLILALATMVVALAQLNLPSRQLWQSPVAVAVQWLSVIAMAVFIVVAEFRSVNALVRIKLIREYDLDLRAALSAVLLLVVQATGAPWDELTVCYYRVRRRPWWKLQLYPIGAVHLGAGPADVTSPVQPEKGLVGTAFASQRILVEDWPEFVRAATDGGPEEWARRTDLPTYGLAWGQLRRSATQQSILASPTFAQDGQPDGCLLLSGPLKLPDLKGAEMRSILDSLATTLDRLGPPPRGWWAARDR